MIIWVMYKIPIKIYIDNIEYVRINIKNVNKILIIKLFFNIPICIGSELEITLENVLFYFHESFPIYHFLLKSLCKTQPHWGRGYGL